MKIYKIMIADGETAFQEALVPVLGTAYRICLCRDGNEAMELLPTFSPDFLVLDLMLSGMDGITLVQLAAEQGIHPVVLATTRFTSDYVLEAAARMGVSYIMRKPCNPQCIAARIADLSQRMEPITKACPDVRATISNLLISLNISTRRRGFPCLREAVLLMMQTPGLSITKELYPAVGKRCGATGDQVERVMRSAIYSAWEERNNATWLRYFRTQTGGQVVRPTNAEFICRLAEYLRQTEASIMEDSSEFEHLVTDSEK